MFGLVISKLVSFKQELILDQIYDISFHERVSRLRSALYLYRSDVNRAMEHMDRDTFTKKRRSDLSSSISNFNTNLIEVKEILCPPKKDFIKNLSDINQDLLINSIELSVLRTGELLNFFDEKEVKWRSLSILGNLKTVTKTNEMIYNYFMERKIPETTREKIKMLNQGNTELISIL
ncbi:MAG: hypothetical protein ABIF40_04760 [archaeon]